MFVIRLRRNAESGAVPAVSDINLGEIAINTFDGKAFIKKSDGVTEEIVELGSGSGGVSSWEDLEGKPSAFPSTWNLVLGKPSLFPPDQHQHIISEIASLQDYLDQKASVTHNHDSAYSLKAHEHSQYITSIDGLTPDENGTVSAFKTTIDTYQVTNNPSLLHVFSVQDDFSGYALITKRLVVKNNSSDSYSQVSIRSSDTNGIIGECTLEPLEIAVFRLDEIDHFAVYCKGKTVEFQYAKSFNNVAPSEDGSLTIPNTVPWADILYKPSTFPPDAHAHELVDILNISSKSDVGHIHQKSEIPNLVQDLNSKSPMTHTHAGVYEPVIATKNTAFNKNFGIQEAEVARGNHTHDDVYISSTYVPPKAAYCKVNRIGNQPIPDNVSPYPAISIQMNNTVFQCAESWAISNYGVLVPKSGIYQVHGYTLWSDDGHSNQQLVIKINDVIVSCAYFAGVTYGNGCHINDVFQLSQGDIVILAVRCVGTITDASLSVVEVL